MDGFDPSTLENKPEEQRNKENNETKGNKDDNRDSQLSSAVMMKEDPEMALNDKKIASMVDNDEIEFVDQYKRVIYSNCDWTNRYFNTNKNDGNLLINVFCAALANNIDNQKNKTDLDDIVQQTRQRLKDKIQDAKYYNKHVIHDQNYIPTRCKILFTSFSPINAVESHLSSKRVDTKKEKEKVQQGINANDENAQSIINGAVDSTNND